jgi:hypothetical protein
MHGRHQPVRTDIIPDVQRDWPERSTGPRPHIMNVTLPIPYKLAKRIRTEGLP